MQLTSADEILNAKLNLNRNASSEALRRPLRVDPLTAYLPQIDQIARGQEVEVPFAVGQQLKNELEKARYISNVKGELEASYVPSENDTTLFDSQGQPIELAPQIADPSSLPSAPPPTPTGTMKLRFVPAKDQNDQITWIRTGGALPVPYGRKKAVTDPANDLYGQVHKQLSERTYQMQLADAAPVDEIEYLRRMNPQSWNEKLFYGTETGRSWAAGYNDLTGNIQNADAFMHAAHGNVDKALDIMQDSQANQLGNELLLSPDDQTSLSKALAQGKPQPLVRAAVNTIARQAPTLGAFTIASLAGGTAGVFGLSTVLGTGEVYNAMVQRDPQLAEATDKAALGGLAYGLLDTASFHYVVQNPLLRRLISRSFLHETQRNPLIQRLLLGVVKGGFTEGTTEAMQEVVKVATAIWADKNQSLLSELGLQELFSPNNMAAYKESFLGGALLGGLSKGTLDTPGSPALETAPQMADTPLPPTETTPDAVNLPPASQAISPTTIGPIEQLDDQRLAGGVQPALDALIADDQDVQVDYQPQHDQIMTMQSLIDDDTIPEITQENYQRYLENEGLDRQTPPDQVIVYGYQATRPQATPTLHTETQSVYLDDVMRLGRGSNLYTVAEEVVERNFKRLPAPQQQTIIDQLHRYEQQNKPLSQGSDLERLSHLAVAQAVSDKLHRQLGFKLRELVDKVRSYLQTVVTSARQLRQQLRQGKVDPLFTASLRELTYRTAQPTLAMMKGIQAIKPQPATQAMNLADTAIDDRLEAFHVTTDPQEASPSADEDTLTAAMGLLDELPATPSMQGIAKTNTTSVYDSARTFKATGRIRRRLKKLMHEAGLALTNPLEIISDTLERIHLSLFQAIRSFEIHYRWAWTKDVQAVKPFLDKFKQMDPADKRELDLALKNSALDRIEPLLAKYGMEQDWQALRQTLDAIHQRANDVGIDAGYLDTYWPRIVDDLPGLRDALHEGEYWSAIQTLINKENALRETPMTDDEEVNFINNLLRGYGEDRLSLSGTNAAKHRLIKTLSPELNVYYLDAATGLQLYLMRLNESIEGRRFFGKGQELKHLDNPIGGYVKRLIDDKIIKPSQEMQVRDILQGRFSSKTPDGIFRVYKNLTYAALLNNPITSLTQLDDFGIAWAREGVLTGLPRALVNLAKAAFNRSEINLSLLGFQDLALEHSTMEGTARTVEWIMKSPLSLFSFADRLGKETILNTIYQKYRRQAVQTRLSKDFIARMERVFGDDTGGVIADLQSGKFTENIRYLMAHELLDTQPVALSEMPLTYLKLKNGKVAYALKTYGLKRLSIIRREGFRKLTRGKGLEKVTGLLDLMRLGFCLVLAGMGVDAVKDFLLGRKTTLDDRVVDNLFKMVGVPKYTIYQARREGPLKTATALVAPPFAMLDSAFFDARDVLTGNYRGSRIVQHVPFVGKSLYWWWGKGSRQNAITDRQLTLDKAVRLYRSGQTDRARELIDDFNRRYPGAALTLKKAVRQANRKDKRQRRTKRNRQYPKDMTYYFNPQEGEPNR